MDGYANSALFSQSFRKYLPGLVGAGVSSVIGAWKAGSRARTQLAIDSRQRFPTRTEPVSTMRMKRRLPTRRSYRPKGKAQSAGIRRMVRTTLVNTSLNIISAGTTAFAANAITMAAVKTSDLITSYRAYRLVKAVVKIVPRYDPGNSGVTLQYQTQISAGCDTENATTPTSVLDVTALDNSYSKFLTDGQVFQYTFYPKVVNAVGLSGAAAYVGSYGTNPWINLDSTGITIPHNCLKLAACSGAAAGVSGIIFDQYIDYHFDVKGF